MTEENKKKTTKKTSKKMATKATKTSGKSKLSQTKDLLVKALKGDDWKASLDPRLAKESQPHLPTGSIIIDHLIGGKPNRWGVPPCPGLPKGRILNLYGHEGSGKCLPADTYVTTEKGLQTIREVFASNGFECTSSNWTKEATVSLYNSKREPENTTHFTSNGKRPVITIKTFSGGEIQATANHPHLVMSSRGAWVWKQTKDLEPGDVMVSERNSLAGTRSVDPDQAYLLGVLLANGHLGESSVSVTNDDPTIKGFLRRAPGLPTPKEYPTNSPNEGQEPSIDFHFNSVEVTKALYHQTGWSPCKAAEKHVGPWIRSFDQDSLREVLRGYVDCKSYVDTDKAEMEMVSASKQLLVEVGLLLRSWGILSLLRDKTVAQYPDTPYWRLIVSGAELRRYVEKIGTRSLRRMGEFEKIGHKQPNTNFDSIPNLGGLLRDLYSTLEESREMRYLFADYMERSSGQPSRARLTYDRLDKILCAVQPNDLNRGLLDQLRLVQQRGYFYDEVIEVSEPSDPVPTFDFAMESSHSFIANGFVTHNTTIALTAAATTIANGGEVVYIDWEHEIVPEYALELGVPIGDEDKFMLCQPDTLDDGIAILWTAASAGVDLIVLDSVGAGVPKKFFEKSISETADQGRIGMNAAVWSSFLPKLKARITKTGTAVIGISQIRSNINAMGYGEQTTVQGGKAWRFYSALRMKLQRIKTEKTGDYSTLTNKTEDRVVGAVIQAKLEKCKVSPQQGNEETFYIRWGEGIDDLRSLIEIAKAHNIIRQSGTWLYWTDPDGEERGKQGMEKFRAMFSADTKLQKVLEKQVRPYIASKGGSTKTAAAAEDDDLEDEFDESQAGEELDEILGKMSEISEDD
jgi:protein RecA